MSKSATKNRRKIMKASEALYALAKACGADGMEIAERFVAQAADQLVTYLQNETAIGTDDAFAFSVEFKIDSKKFDAERNPQFCEVCERILCDCGCAAEVRS
jgi:hypothetical protein